MKIKVGTKVRVGGKVKEIVEIQEGMFGTGVVYFDDKTSMGQRELLEVIEVVDDFAGMTFDHLYNHHFEGWGEERYYLSDKAHWIYNKMKRGWKSVSNLKHVYLDGMIAKKDLVDGAIYLGHCRNAGYAVWIGDKSKFEYIREKFGSEFLEDINHPEDDDGYDIFVPILKTEYKLLTDCPV